MRGPRNWRGEPTWTLHDPLRHRFIQIVERDFYLLTAWRRGVAQAVLDQASVESGDHYDLDELEGLLDFLAREELLSADSMGLRTRLVKLDAQRRQSLFQTLLHKYLFFRLPLVRPDALLDRLYVHARVLMQPWFIGLSLLLGAIGLIAIIRNWSMFINSFSFLFSVSGMVVFVVTLACVKILHELGHALMCKHFGLQVPTMGIAFLVMWPVLYTDATDSWRLDSRHKRAAIAAAGVGVELLLACYAMLFWVILPDGVARSVAFVVATTAWITSALVNLNPLMRFDGYYFLSDMINVPNLQDRSIALARWQLRGWLFGAGEPCPDDLPPRLLRGVMVYAWALLIYRFFLFLGIAFLVYHFFFKALGIFLFLVEIWWFIGRPIYRELKEWPEYLQETSSRRKRLALVGLGLLLLILLFPWRTDIHAPAVLSASRQLAVYSSQPAQVAELLVRDRQRVEQGELLLRLHSPDLEQALVMAGHEVSRLQALLAQADTSDRLISERLVLGQRLAQALAEQAGLRRQLAQLEIHASFSGVVRDLDPTLRQGRWLGTTDRLMTLIDTSEPVVMAWVSESDLDMISAGAAGRFYSEQVSGPQALEITVERISSAATAQLDSPYQASVYGGDVPVKPIQGGALYPAQAYFQLYGHLNSDAGFAEGVDKRQRGTLYVEGRRRSMLVSAGTWLLAALVRESGF